MADYDNTDRGTLFTNKKKENEKHPDFNGSLNVNGTEFWISAWRKESKAGEKFLSLSVRPKQEQTRQASQPTRQTKKADDWEDLSF